VKLPKSIDFETAAAMMLKGLTVQYLFRRTYKLQRGQTILFHAAAGGVGLIAMQWAKALGVTVIGSAPDGNVDATDFLLLIGQWGSPCTGSCEADFTGPTGVPDGDVDSCDYLALIAQWRSPAYCPGACSAITEMAMGGGSGGELPVENWIDLLDEVQSNSESAHLNGLCWLFHYLGGCPESCTFGGCGGSDPLGRH
jgi:hypothetical protein